MVNEMQKSEPQTLLRTGKLGSIWCQVSFTTLRGSLSPLIAMIGMPELIGPGPLGEINPHNNLRLDPNTRFHLLRGQARAPPAWLFLRQIRKRTLGDL
jgi:hypothetical protein